MLGITVGLTVSFLKCSVFRKFVCGEMSPQMLLGMLQDPDQRLTQSKIMWRLNYHAN